MVVSVTGVFASQGNVAVREHVFCAVLHDRVTLVAMTMERAAHEHVQTVSFGIQDDRKWDVNGRLTFAPQVDVVSVCDVMHDERTRVKPRLFFQLFNQPLPLFVLRCVIFVVVSVVVVSVVAVLVLRPQNRACHEANYRQKELQSLDHRPKIRDKSNHELPILQDLGGFLFVLGRHGHQVHHKKGEVGHKNRECTQRKLHPSLLIDNEVRCDQDEHAEHLDSCCPIDCVDKPHGRFASGACHPPSAQGC